MADSVNLLNPDGKLVSVPTEQAKDALGVGYSQPAPEDISKYQQEEKYGGVGSQIGAGLEGAASAATLGVSTALEAGIGKATGIEALQPEAIQGRRDVNPGTHALGQVAGLVGGALALPELSAAKAMGAAGEAVAGAIPGLAETGVLSKIGSAAVKASVENMIFQSGDEVSKMFSSTNSDPAEATQTALANVGLSGLIGGGIGGTLGAISPLWEATAGKKLNGILENITNEASGTVGAPTENQSIIDAINGKMNTVKPNSNEIAETLARNNIKPPPGIFSDDEFIKRMASGMTKSGTISGADLAKDWDKVYRKSSDLLESSFRDATTETQAETGRKISKGMLDNLEERLKPIEETYAKHEPFLKQMEITPEIKQAAIDEIANHPNVAKAGTYENLANELTDRISRVKNVHEVAETRTLINSELQKAFNTSNYPEAEILQTAKKALTGMEESGIENAARSTGIGKKEAGAISADMIQEIKANRVAYRDYKTLLRTTGEGAKLGNLGSARQLLEQMKGLSKSDESFATRLLNIDNVKQMEFFKKEYPKEFELARRYKLRDILDRATDETVMGGQNKFNPGKALGIISDRNMNSEARQILFAGHLQKVDDAKLLFQEMLKNYNPSGSASEISYGKILTPSGMLDNVADRIKYGILKGLPQAMEAAGTTDAKATKLGLMSFLASGKAPEGAAFKAAVDFISKTIKGENLIQDATTNLFKAGREVIPSKAIPDDKKLEKLDKKLKELQTDATPIFNTGGATAHYLPEHGSAMGLTAGTAVQYLNGLRPNVHPQSPLDAKLPVSAQAKAKFQNALRVAEQPLIAIDQIKDGTLNSETMTHLKTMYPALYQKVSQQLVNNMANAMHKEEVIPYKTRMGLSLFLGQPLDSTMKPQSIVATQPQPGSQAPNPEQAQAQPKRHDMSGLAKGVSQFQTPLQARQQSRSKA